MEQVVFTSWSSVVHELKLSRFSAYHALRSSSGQDFSSIVEQIVAFSYCESMGKIESDQEVQMTSHFIYGIDSKADETSWCMQSIVA